MGVVAKRTRKRPNRAFIAQRLDRSGQFTVGILLARSKLELVWNSASSGGVVARGLADTGAILALVDADDRWHARCVDAFEDLRLPLATTSAILTDLFHLLDHPGDAKAAWRFLQSGAITVLPKRMTIHHALTI